LRKDENRIKFSRISRPWPLPRHGHASAKSERELVVALKGSGGENGKGLFAGGHLEDRGKKAGGKAGLGGVEIYSYSGSTVPTIGR